MKTILHRQAAVASHRMLETCVDERRAYRSFNIQWQGAARAIECTVP
jgi:hypothetical protein